MYCVKNRIYYHDCNTFYFDNVMRKHCCVFNNHALLCRLSKLCPKKDVGVQIDF